MTGALQGSPVIRVVACLAGAALVIVALGLDVLAPGGSAGFGRSQTVMLLAGLAVFVIGLDADFSALRLEINSWRSSPRATLAALGKYALILLQLTLLLVVVRQFEIESELFRDVIAPMVIGGFAVHYLLPASARLAFFALLSMSVVWIVFGAAGAPWLLGIGLGLIAICHLPLSFTGRVLLLLGVGGVLVAARSEWFQGPFPAAIWPILGSMFMFRLIVYMYDLRHSKQPVDWRRSLAYFFLLPNVAFPLFPVVDWSTFRRTYYDRERHAIYQRGVQWILRGITHLLAYRLVYQTMLIPAEQVSSAFDLGRFMLATFLLYLRVSGQFHLIVGILHLFGFRLPETHRLFYFASSFSDFWRRINVYWKDFMMKLVFYPALFRLKRFGQTTSIVLATLLVFVATWALHAYQWFWLLGEWLFTGPDILFWAILALLLVANSLYEIRYGRERTIGPARLRFSSLAPKALGTAVTFTVICILWSLWSSHSVEDWLTLWGALDVAHNDGLRLPGMLGVVVLGVGAMASSTTPDPQPGAASKPGARQPVSFATDAWRTAGAAALIVVLGHPEVSPRLGATAGGVLRDLRASQMSAADQEVMRRGYYENLTAPNPLNAALFEVYSRPLSPKDWPSIVEAGLARSTGDVLDMELLPLRGTVYKGSLLRTNRWGMRDRDYPRAKPANTYRMALLGASYVMGDGVGDDETFEALVEARLARERKTADPHVEIMNFATPNYQPLRHLVLLHRKVFDFAPDAVLMVSHASDGADIPIVIAEAAAARDQQTLAHVRPVLDSLGIDLTLGLADLKKALAPHRDVLLAHTYGKIARDLHDRGIVPLWIHAPTPNNDPTDPRIAKNEAMATSAGFFTIDLQGVYAGTDPRSLWISEWDYHPNAKGHRLIADGLYSALLERCDVLPIRPSLTNTGTQP